MRVIAGSCRGRRLKAPAGAATRPTGDRVREAVFDMLQSTIDLAGTTVVDLFAGSGALGIEALSRGAATAVFVEQSPAALEAIAVNLGSLGLQENARVVRADACRWVVDAPSFDLALCDPPYGFDGWPDLLAHLDTPLAVLESSSPVELPARWEAIREKRYGGTLVTVARRGPREPIDQKGTQ